MEILFYGKIPIFEHIVKKNNRPIYINSRTGKSFIGKGARLNKAEDHMLLQLLSLKNNKKIYEPIRHDLRAMFIFGFKDFYTKKGIRRQTIPDLSNLYELPQDILQKALIIEDDNIICNHDGSDRIPADENFLEITLFKISKSNRYSSLELDLHKPD